MFLSGKTLGQRGVSLVEMMMTVLIMALLISGGFLIFYTGQAAWFTTGSNITLQENLRKSLERMVSELRQSQTARVIISNDAGPGGTDVIEFSIPIICEAGGFLVNAGGDIANWGVPLTWGCDDSTCMDADDDCLSVDYAKVEYGLNNSNQLVRRVLNAVDTVVRTDIFAENISDLQITVNGTLYTFDVTTQITADNNRVLSARVGTSVALRN